MVGLAHSAPYVMPADPERPLDRCAARLRDLGLNRLPFALIGRSPRRWLDFIGVNYYNRTLVRWAPRGRAILLGEDDDRPRNGEARRFSDIGWEVWPEGLGATLRAMAAYGLPLLVTENGIATTDEDLRVEYLVSHLREVARATAAGVPVAGYLHWSLIDNYEWTLGFAPRFGLCAVDRATQARTPRRAAEVYAEICRSGRIAA
jgi:beta-glucosidase